MREPRRLGGSNSRLVELERELTRWRKTHHAPTPLPEEVWTRAAKLGAQLGVNNVARSLRLNPTHLKRKMEACVAPEPAVADFIELLPPVSTTIAECAMEVESPHGSRLRIVMRDVSTSCLAGLLREFAG